MPVRKRLLSETKNPKTVEQASSEPEVKVEPRLLTIPQIAKYLNTSVWSVREMIRAQRLRRVPICGKKIVVDRADVDALIEQLKEAA